MGVFFPDQDVVEFQFPEIYNPESVVKIINGGSCTLKCFVDSETDNSY